MKNKILLFGLAAILVLFLASQCHAAQFTLSMDTFNRISSSTSDWMKGNMFVWYAADTTGALREEYANERKIVDFLLFFIMFFSLALLGLKQAFKEGGNAVNALAFAIGALLALALVAFTKVSLALLFPFAKNIIFMILLWVIFLMLKKMFGDKHPFWLFILALIIALIAFNLPAIGPKLGITDMTVPRADQSQSIDEIQTKIDQLSMSTDPNKEAKIESLKKSLADAHYKQALMYVGSRDYDSAKMEFAKTLEANPSHTKAKYWLDEGLFNRMVKETLVLLGATKEILNVMSDDYLKTHDSAECAKMANMLRASQEAINKTRAELLIQKERIAREKERLGTLGGTTTTTPTTRTTTTPTTRTGWIGNAVNGVGNFIGGLFGRR
jgi:tetratricopeptide (TPR) repeat protein